MAEGVTPHIIHSEVIADVVVSIPIVPAWVEGILGVNDVRIAPDGVQTEGRKRVVGNFIQGVAPGIAGLELESAGERVVCSNGKAVVVGIGNVLSG